MNVKEMITLDVAKAAMQDAVSLVAPRVSQALSGKTGGVVTEAAVRAVSRELLGTDTPEPQRLSERLHNLSAEDQAKLAEIDADLATETAQIAAQDRANARARQIETGDMVPAVLAFMAFGSLIALAGALLFLSPDGVARDLLMIVLGAIVTMAKQGYDFFLGSSKGSKDKTNLMAGVKR